MRCNLYVNIYNIYVYILRYYFFFFWSSPLLLIFFFQYAHRQWHVRDIEFSYNGRRGQNTAVIFSSRHARFEENDGQEKKIIIKKEARLVPWSGNRNDRNLYVHKTQGNKKRRHCKTAAAKKKKKRVRSWAVHYIGKGKKKKVCAMTCEIQKYVCRTQREMWESTISRASGDQKNTGG